MSPACRSSRLSSPWPAVTFCVFTKTKMRETAEIERAKQAMARGQREGHTPDADEEG